MVRSQRGCGAAFPYCAALGPSWVANLVNTVGAATNCDVGTKTQGYFQDTVILITWDDWGGWYDHVNPNPIQLGYPDGSGKNNVYGFRVPLLVVSAYSPVQTPPNLGYVSGAAAVGTAPTQCPGPPYCHDFGSILNFIEYVFGNGGNSAGEISSSSYHYADYFAPDAYPTCPRATCPYSLSDFFNFNQNPSAFKAITVPVRYSVSYFQNYSAPPQAPDND